MPVLEGTAQQEGPAEVLKCGFLIARGALEVIIWMAVCPLFDGCFRWKINFFFKTETFFEASGEMK